MREIFQGPGLFVKILSMFPDAYPGGVQYAQKQYLCFVQKVECARVRKNIKKTIYKSIFI
jgi:hypothetical protein